MKYRYILIFSLFLNLCYSQKEKAEVIKIRTLEKIFSATINQKYSTTIYLKLSNYSDEHSGIYSVKGWYYYDNIKTKIPLVGIFDGDLTLFNLKSKVEENKILNFKTDEQGNLWDKIEALKKTQDFEEKFEFSLIDNKIDGKWYKGTNKLDVQMIDENINIYKEYEFLQINNGNEFESINLYDLNLYVTNFDLISYSKTASQISVLLNYEYMSRPYIMGMCGAGQEFGYVVLTYDLEYNLIETEIIEVESCLNQITSEKDEKNENKITIYKDGNPVKTQILIDKKNAKIIKLKK